MSAKTKDKGPSAKSKRDDQRYVAKAEIDEAGKKKLRALAEENIKIEAAVPTLFDRAVSKVFGKRFLKRLKNTAPRRKMSPRQYALAILVKPDGKK